MMRDFIMRHKVGAATIVAALVVAAFSIYMVPLNPPLGDCFGGALSQDPLICYVLEQADRQGIITVETVYDAEGILYFSLWQNEPAGSHVYEFLKTKSYEFYDRWPDDVPVNPKYDWWCTPDRGFTTYRQCYLDMTSWRPSFMLPESMVYTNVLFHTGGESARRLVPGWASWRQVWPAIASGASGVSDSSTAPSTFDVSDVDMTNLPVVACNKVLHGIRLDICSRDRDVAMSVVGRHAGGGGVYFQIKDPPEDKAELAALKEILFPCYDKIGSCTYTATTTVTRMVDGIETHVERTSQIYMNTSKVSKVEIIPVKYGAGDLVRWADILDRFATSTGNTIGITGARVQDNRDTYAGHTIFRMSPAALGPYSPAVPEASDFVWSTVRETIVVWGFDAQRIADALATLLPLLGIPVDAVGVVVTDIREAIWRSFPGGAAGDTGNIPSREPVVLEGFKENLGGLRVPLLLLARNVGAVLVAGGIVALVLRLRRRRAPG